jgi:hypothetical protein
MPSITWGAPFCGEGNAYIAVNGREDHYLTDSADAAGCLRACGHDAWLLHV